MSLKDDLEATRALIDTPEKWEARGIVLMLARATDCDDDRYAAARDALLGSQYSIESASYMPHDHIMALFDRAINAVSIASLDAAIAECAKPLPRHA